MHWTVIPDGTLRPRAGWVDVAPHPTPDTRPSGLVIPDTALDERRSSVGEVLAVGPEVRDLRPGDTLVYPRWAGTEVQVGDRLHILLPARNQLALLAEG